MLTVVSEVLNSVCTSFIEVERYLEQQRDQDSLLLQWHRLTDTNASCARHKQCWPDDTKVCRFSVTAVSLGFRHLSLCRLSLQCLISQWVANLPAAVLWKDAAIFPR